ncbi:MAG TPA: HAD-IC family P-type ATPase [Kineosporiaceae bacterium]|nr:HAD-IC family P-type ATPase [Kineosporiaceae bacterium]
MAGRADRAQVRPAPDLPASAAAGLPPPEQLHGIPAAQAARLGRLQVLRRLDSGPRGLPEAEALHRLAAREPAEPSRCRGLRRRAATALLPALTATRDPYTLVIAVLAAVSARLGAVSGAALLTGVAALGWSLRLVAVRRTARAAEAARTSGDGTVTVLRRMTAQAAPAARELPVGDLVPGDVVHLSPGDLVPADLYLLRATGLQLDRSALTGESAPVHRRAAADGDPAGAPLPEADLPDHPGLCLAGCHITAGTGVGLVLATAPGTWLDGHPVRGASRSPFDRSAIAVTGLLARLTLLVLGLALVVAAIGRIAHRPWPGLGFAAVTAIGLTPEILPVVVAVILAGGSARLRRSGATGRRLTAVHDLGTVDVLCVDKTGTLTHDRLTPALAAGPDGRPDPAVLRLAALHSRIGAELGDPPYLDAFDDALLRDGGDIDGGDPDDGAPDDGDRDRGGLRTATGVEVLPFDPVRRCATVVLRGARPGRQLLLVKGAVDAVLDRCTQLGDGGGSRPLSSGDRTRLAELAAGHARRGLRVIALAEKDVPARTRPYRPGDEHDLTLLGLVGFRDEPDPSAGPALDRLHRDGVALKIVTGDGAGTAVRACHDLGLDPGEVVPGSALDALDDAELARTARTATVFAQVNPAQKARLVRVLRAGGHTVGYLGDGVNDVPALLASDIGISPHRAVPAARDAAGVVLTAPGLAAVTGALSAARRAVTNLGTYLRIGLACNVGNVLAMLAAGAFLPFLPMLPGQIVVQNACFDLAQLSLALDRPGRRDAAARAVADLRGLTRFALGFGALNAVVDLVTFAALRQLGGGLAAPQAQALFHAGWFTENLVTQALTLILLRPGARHRAVPAPIALAAAALAGAGLALPWSPVAAALGFAALPAAYYPVLALIVAGYLVALRATRRLRG